MPILIRSRKTVDTDISQAIDMGVSQSEFSTYDLCHYRWYLEKVRMLTSIRPEFVLTVGTAYHMGMDWLYRSEGKKVGVPKLEFNKLAKLTPEEEELAIHWHKILTTMIEAYRVHYKDDFGSIEIVSLEQVLRTSIQGINLCGALDLAGRKNRRVVIWDHKTKGIRGVNSSAPDEWKTRFQFLLYTVMWNKLNPEDRAQYFLANVSHKPALSIKKGESQPAFYARLKKDVIARKDEYFKRETVPMDRDMLTAFQENFLFPKIQNFKMLQTIKPDTREYEALVLQRNSAACWSYGRQCPFYSHCHSGKKLKDLSHLTTRKLKHEHYEEKE